MNESSEIRSTSEVEVAWAAYRRTRCATEQRRLQVIGLYLEGKSRKEISSITKYERHTIGSIISKYLADGISTAKDLRHDNIGAPRIFTEIEREEIRDYMADQIAKGELLSGNSLSDYLRGKYKKDFCEKTTYNLMHELGFSLQTPRPSHEKADKEKQEEFKTKF